MNIGYFIANLVIGAIIISFATTYKKLTKMAIFFYALGILIILYAIIDRFFFPMPLTGANYPWLN